MNDVDIKIIINLFYIFRVTRQKRYTHVPTRDVTDTVHGKKERKSKELIFLLNTKTVK